MKADDLLDHLEDKYGPDPDLRAWLQPVVHRILTLKGASDDTDELLLLVVDVYSRDVRVRQKLRLARRAMKALSHQPSAFSRSTRAVPPADG